MLLHDAHNAMRDAAVRAHDNEIIAGAQSVKFWKRRGAAARCLQYSGSCAGGGGVSESTALSPMIPPRVLL